MTIVISNGYRAPQSTLCLSMQRARAACALARDAGVYSLPQVGEGYCCVQALRLDPGNAAMRRDLLEVQHCGSADAMSSAAVMQFADARLAAQVMLGLRVHIEQADCLCITGM